MNYLGGYPVARVFQCPECWKTWTFAEPTAGDWTCCGLTPFAMPDPPEVK